MEQGFSPTRRRRSIRWKGFDYSRQGGYFVTICTQGRQCSLGTVADGEVRLNRRGEIVRDCWRATPEHLSGIELDCFVVMPNHVHAILLLFSPSAGKAPCGEPTRQFGLAAAGTLGVVVRSFKSAASRIVADEGLTDRGSLWQRNYHEHVIRGDRDLAAIRKYIAENPLKWSIDRENPEARERPPANPFEA